ncbi:hypothetical protein J9B83_01595 [Marinomonas sp. A79]|uniref:Uncharacterized protein n=1 Tax=Marinomonas vulgaris TaxID=2823372 RepID=A0ABS5H849_9GAMM|nr:hypothetical protein [Marinomonas vulgaris]MBR7887617.1 hypothetical protein [Marinomonas vulgaris]
MLISKKAKLKSTPFSDFFRYAKSAEKRKFFDRIAKKAIEEQQQMLEKAKNMPQ